MNRLKSVIRIALKSALYFVIAVIFLLVSAIILIRIPAVQQKVLHITVSWLHKKTNSRIEIKSIYLTLNSVQIDGVLFKDLAQDTLLSAEELEINLNVPALLKKRIEISGASMKNVVAQISRNEKDSAFNFDFLVKAFSGNKKKPAKKDTVKDPFDLSVDEVNLENIRFIYDDQFSGIYFTSAFISWILRLTNWILITSFLGPTTFSSKACGGKWLSGKKIILILTAQKHQNFLLYLLVTFA